MWSNVDVSNRRQSHWRIMYAWVNLLFLFLFQSRTTAQNCSFTACSGSSLPIYFPFRVAGSQQPEKCGYPGFCLSCDSLGTTVLELPHSGKFFVRKVNYLTQQIQVNDPDNCLPRRLLQLNLSDSPFSADYYQNYTFLSCPLNISSRYSAISCLSNSTSMVLATLDKEFAQSMAAECSIIAIRQIPMSFPDQDDQGTSDDLNQDLQLSWFVPNCMDCEIKGGMCGFAGNSSQDIGCFDVPNTGQLKKGLWIFKILCLSIAVPVVMSSIGIAFIICCKDGGRERNWTISLPQRNVDPAAVTSQPIVLLVGLDDSTIDSFTKVVLGESLRLSGPNDNVCPICLVEYRPKDILRFIPDCKHCFHIECIDEWLKMSNTCPVCRNTPSPAFANKT